MKALFVLAALAVGCAQKGPAAKPPGTTGVAECAPNDSRLREGELAPDFVGVGHDGSRVALSDLRSRTVVLHFLPQSSELSPPAATATLRQDWSDLVEQGVIVVGVARRRAVLETSERTNAFVLVADTDNAVSNAYGWSMPYRDGDRRTFVIGPDGTIEKIYCIPGA